MGHIYSEKNKIRQFLLKCYAFKEVELLQLLFWVSGLSIMKQALFRKPFYYLFAHVLGSRGVVCMAATLEETNRFIDELQEEHRMAVGPCRCRVGNKNCDHEIMTDIVIKEGVRIWQEDLFPEDYRIITREEAKKIVKESREAGMIQCIDRHMYFKRSENFFVICNCCKESCVPIVAYRVFKDEPYNFHPSLSVSANDKQKCSVCMACIDACPFEERALLEDENVIKINNCQGCGLCVDVCPNGANWMILREQSPN